MTPDDLDVMAAGLGDPTVMAFYPAPKSRQGLQRGSAGASRVSRYLDGQATVPTQAHSDGFASLPMRYLDRLADPSGGIGLNAGRALHRSRGRRGS